MKPNAPTLFDIGELTGSLTDGILAEDAAEFKEPRPDTSVDFAVIIPVYKHSVLLIEAVESALSQEVDGNVSIIIVNDGCPHLETHLLCFSLSRTYDNIVYMNRPHEGPSAARNYALDYIDAVYPDLKAVFFLDADNRLAPNALAHGWSLLLENESVGWIYAPINGFEIEWSGDYDIRYSRLLHITFQNLCDTGSLIRANLVKRLRFNTHAMSGFEDWDFWLEAISHGFVGLCSSSIGIEYRNRAESRAKDAARDHQAITRYLNDRYKLAFRPSTLLKYEHEEAPRYCHFSSDNFSSVMFTDPELPATSLPIKEFSRHYWAAAVEPERFLVPEIVIWGKENIFAKMNEPGIARNVLWLIERSLKLCQLVVVSLTRNVQEFKVEFRPIHAGDVLSERVSLIAGRLDAIRGCVADNEQRMIKSLLTNATVGSCIELKISAPMQDDDCSQPLYSLVNSMALAISQIRSSVFSTGIEQKWPWRSSMFPALSEYPALLERYVRSATLWPCGADGSVANVAFVVPFGSFGGAEKTAHACAKQLRKAGMRTHLFVIGGGSYRVIPEFEGAFVTVNVIGIDAPPMWGGKQQARGIEFGLSNDPQMKASVLVGLLASMDVVINCQAAPLNAAVGDLRALGIFVISYLHLFDLTDAGRETGHPALALLFEHSYDLFLVCSHNLRSRLYADGIPLEKLMTIENAPSVSVRNKDLEAIREKRSDLAPRLKALYIGRFDVQKGIDRLAGVVEQCKSFGIDVDFRVIGEPVIRSKAASEAIGRLKRVNVRAEPPIFRSEGLLAALTEADVMLLPSRWEGAPLAILEAQQVGCIPIATDVGAVGELIQNGHDGLLIPEGDDSSVVRGFVQALSALQNNAELRCRLAVAAIEKVQHVSWDITTREFVNFLSQRVPRCRTV